MTAQLSTPPGSPGSRVVGLGTYRPSRIIDNAEICRRIDSTDEWIRTRSGIRTRRWADDSETLTVMATAAAGKAMSEAGITGDQVGCVLVATASHLSQTPSLAAIVTHELGADGASAMDVSAACAGFVYGVGMASDMVRAGSVGGDRPYVVVIGAERLSDLTDQDDRSTAFLFADGAGSVVIGPAGTAGIGPIVWGADGSGADLIRQRQDWRSAWDADQPVWPALVQEGAKVFRWASYAMAPVAREALAKAGITADQLDAFVPHQANMRIIDALIKTLGLPESVAIGRDIADQGNTSAASIPLALDRLRELGEVASGDLALLIGFGAGLVHAALVVRVP
jgi:3-oxoacyl-[acyl-carrier-protein] synthase-3